MSAGDYQGLAGLLVIDFLSHHISSRGTVPLPSKVQEVAYFPHPGSLKALQEFLGLVNFYSCFLPWAAHLLQPLYDVLQQKADNDPNNWTSKWVQAFGGAKSSIVNAAVLAHPDPTALTADASDVSVGAVVKQRVADEW